MPTSQEMRVQRTFDKAMDQINNLQKVFRDEGQMAKAVVDIGGNQDFGAIQEAFDNLYGALEDAHYDAMAHIEVESAKQKLGMTEDKSMQVNKEIDLAGDSIWDREKTNPAKVMVTDIVIENPYEPGNYMDDDEDDGYRNVTVMHDGPWTIYTDSGFEEEISAIVGFEVTFTEQGMQDDGRASMEGSINDKMEAKMESNIKEGDGIYHDCAKSFKHEKFGECTVIPGEHTLLEDGTVTHYDATFIKEGKKYIVKNVPVANIYDVVSEGHSHKPKKKKKESVEENTTDDDSGEEIKVESPDLARLKQLIGHDSIREMKK